MNKLEIIQSIKNARVKEWKKLLTKKGREQSGKYIVEGHHLVEAAIQNQSVIEIIAEEHIDVTNIPVQLPRTGISKEISKLITDTESPQGIYAVCKKETIEIDLHIHKRFLLLDRVQDPGNLGTMIRTADACGIDAIIVGRGSGDVYNPKVIRSAQGSHFHLPIIHDSLTNWVERLREHGIPVYGSALEHAVDYRTVEPCEAFACIMGNEGSGMDQALMEKTEKNLYIPIRGKAESLNVAVACGILLYHLQK